MTEVYDVFGSGFDNADRTKPLSVLEAKRIHKGTVTVVGTIVSVTEIWSLKDASDYKDARSIQLEDVEKKEDSERLDAILYDDNIEDVRAGEIVKVTGKITMENKNAKTKKLITVLHIDEIEYINRKQISISEADIKSFNEFARDKKTLIERLRSKFAPDVIGHDEIKIGLLRAIVGANDFDVFKNVGRLDTLLVGPPGTAKTTLMIAASNIKPNSRYVSAPHASSKTITAIVDKELDGGTVLKWGSVPLAAYALCCVNEIAAFPPDEQDRFLETMSEGRIPLDKHGNHYDIPAPTTIIATANPIGGDWADSDRISNDEIFLKKNLLDRFTQIYPIRDNKGEEELRVFADKLSIIRGKRQNQDDDCDEFLRKYLIYASSRRVKISEDARRMLNEFWVRAKLKGLVGNRMHGHLFKVAEAHAKLYLRDEVDEDIAKEAMQVVNFIILNYGATVDLMIGPRDVTCKKFIDILRNTKAGITIEELCRIACKEDEQIAAYVGEKWSVEQNYKLRSVVDILRNNKNVKPVSARPIVLQWLSDVSDVTEEGSSIEKIKNLERLTYDDEDNAVADTSDTSDKGGISASNANNNGSKTIDHNDPVKCPTCDYWAKPFYMKIHQCPNVKQKWNCEICIKNHKPRFKTNDKEEYKKHMQTKHRLSA